MLSLSDLRTGNDVAAYATWLFGRPFAPRPGLVHVVAVHVDKGDLRVMRIRGETPRSEHDAFMLSVARARADAIVTTGRILRSEPGLRHELTGSSATIVALEQWAEGLRGHDVERLSIILTGGRGFPSDHPLLDGATRTLVVCPTAASKPLRERLAGAGVEVVGMDQVTLPAVVTLLREDYGARTVLLEAGPSTVRSLYDGTGAPDEMMLAEYVGPIPDSVVGDRLVSRRRLSETFDDVGYGPTIGPAGRAWRFAWLERNR